MAASVPSNYDDVLVSVDNSVAVVVLNRPESLNSVTRALAEHLEQTLTALGARDDVNVIVLRGAGGNFSAGGDFDEVRRLREAGPGSLLKLFEAFGRALAVMATVRQPVVAAVEGVAMAGGFELIQAADIVLVHENVRARDTHIRFGWIPGGGSTQRLPRQVGRHRAMSHLLSGDTLSAADLVNNGLAHRAFRAETFDTDVRAFVTELAQREPLAVAAIKALVARSFESDLADGLAEERAAVVELISGPAGEAAFARFAGR